MLVYQRVVKIIRIFHCRVELLYLLFLMIATYSDEILIYPLLH